MTSVIYCSFVSHVPRAEHINRTLSSLLCYVSLKMAVQEDLEEERKEEEELKRQNAKRKRRN